MLTDISASHFITSQHFTNLFSETISPDIIDTLSQYVAEGDELALDMLFNIALRQDSAGHQAEKKLFNLFSGREPCRPGVREGIQTSALAVYDLAGQEKMRNQPDMQKLHTPTRLLYMAGSGANITQQHDISSIFNPDDALTDNNLWHGSRQLTSDEIYNSLKKGDNPASANDTAHLNFPIGLLCPYTQENQLTEQVVQQMQNPSFLQKPELFPINTGNHWVLFGLYKTEGNAPVKAFVFDSANALGDNTRARFIDTAKIAGVTEDRHITFIAKDIQQNVPNGCGVFTVKAIELLLEENQNMPETVLGNYIDNFSGYSPEVQSTFNQQKRWQIFENAFLEQQVS